MDIYFRLNRKWYHEFIEVIQTMEIYGVYTIEVRKFPEPPDFLLRFVLHEAVKDKETEFIQLVKEAFEKKDLSVSVTDKEHSTLIIGTTFEPEHKVRTVD